MGKMEDNEGKYSVEEKKRSKKQEIRERKKESRACTNLGSVCMGKKIKGSGGCMLNQLLCFFLSLPYSFIFFHTFSPFPFNFLHPSYNSFNRATATL